jgi:hypothetical protein
VSRSRVARRAWIAASFVEQIDEATDGDSSGVQGVEQLRVGHDGRPAQEDQATAGTQEDSVLLTRDDRRSVVLKDLHELLARRSGRGYRVGGRVRGEMEDVRAQHPDVRASRPSRHASRLLRRGRRNGRARVSLLRRRGALLAHCADKGLVGCEAVVDAR